MQFELRILKAGRKHRTWAVWEGRDAEDAMQRYAASNPGVTVFGWRDYPRYGLFTEGIGRYPHLLIVEPGHPDWGKKR